MKIATSKKEKFEKVVDRIPVILIIVIIIIRIYFGEGEKIRELSFSIKKAPTLNEKRIKFGRRGGKG